MVGVSLQMHILSVVFMIFEIFVQFVKFTGGKAIAIQINCFLF